MDPELLRQVWPIFSVEAREQLAVIGGGLLQLEAVAGADRAARSRPAHRPQPEGGGGQPRADRRRAAGPRARGGAGRLRSGEGLAPSGPGRARRAGGDRGGAGRGGRRRPPRWTGSSRCSSLAAVAGGRAGRPAAAPAARAVARSRPRSRRSRARWPGCSTGDEAAAPARRRSAGARLLERCRRPARWPGRWPCVGSSARRAPAGPRRAALAGDLVDLRELLERGERIAAAARRRQATVGPRAGLDARRLAHRVEQLLLGEARQARRAREAGALEASAREAMRRLEPDAARPPRSPARSGSGPPSRRRWSSCGSWRAGCGPWRARGTPRPSSSGSPGRCCATTCGRCAWCRRRRCWSRCASSCAS